MTSRILVVEDEALIAEEIRDRLMRLAYEVVGVVDSGPDAIAWASRTRPDLVLMDVHLKGMMDGIEAAGQIYREQGYAGGLPDGVLDRATVDRARSDAQFGYVLKPCSERDLLVAVEMAIHRSQQEQQLKESQLSYAAILASSADAILAADSEGRVRFLNPVAERLLGWEPRADPGAADRAGADAGERGYRPDGDEPGPGRADAAGGGGGDGPASAARARRRVGADRG